MKNGSPPPAEVSIEPRNRQHDITRCLSRDWYDNDPFKTAWFNSMSITFPLGEKFFIESVRHFADKIEDPKLQAEIRGFCGQEGFHSREHRGYNKALCEQRGYDLAYLEGRLEKNINMSKKYFNALEQLAITAALEHITAILAESGLDEDNPLWANADPLMRELWDWHAAEEMEHKGVAFDVFIAMGGTDKMRRKALRQSTFFLLVDIMVGVVHMLRRDKKMWSWRLWAGGWKFLFFKGGMLRRVWPAYKEFYRAGFHPWQRDTRHLLDNWKASQAQISPEPA